MARRTNYAFERNARAKAKAAKREAKQQAKLAAKAEKLGTSADDDANASPGQAAEAEGNESTHNDDAMPRDSS